MPESLFIFPGNVQHLSVILTHSELSRKTWSKQRVYNSRCLVSGRSNSKNSTPQSHNWPHVCALAFLRAECFGFSWHSWNIALQSVTGVKCTPLLQDWMYEACGKACACCTVEWAGRTKQHQTNHWSLASLYWSQCLLHTSLYCNQSCNVVAQLTRLLIFYLKNYIFCIHQSAACLGWNLLFSNFLSYVMKSTRAPASGFSSAVTFRSFFPTWHHLKVKLGCVTLLIQYASFSKD